jgi:hypothetical protein
MINYRYINKNIQSTYISYTLLIEDEDKDEFQDTIRIDKTFKVDSRIIDEEFLREQARLEIDRIIYELENPVEIPPMDLPIELPEEVPEE